MNRMTLLLLAAATAAALFVPADGAKAANYCLAGDIEQCQFTSLEQCLAAASGNGRFCIADYSTEPTVPARPRRR